uniref:Putative secreted protein n=1 Tax=Amblyomma cajennense TaxID=34607 RepID=A0A023FBM1_AMBCJ
MKWLYMHILLSKFTLTIPLVAPFSQSAPQAAANHVNFIVICTQHSAASRTCKQTEKIATHPCTANITNNIRKIKHVKAHWNQILAVATGTMPNISQGTTIFHL